MLILLFFGHVKCLYAQILIALIKPSYKSRLWQSQQGTQTNLCPVQDTDWFGCVAV